MAEGTSSARIYVKRLASARLSRTSRPLRPSQPHLRFWCAELCACFRLIATSLQMVQTAASLLKISKSVNDDVHLPRVIVREALRQTRLRYVLCVTVVWLLPFPLAALWRLFFWRCSHQSPNWPCG